MHFLQNKLYTISEMLLVMYKYICSEQKQHYTLYTPIDITAAAKLVFSNI